MPETDQTTKQRRKELVYNCVMRHDRGIPEKDIADELNLGQRSVNTYLRELEIEGKVEREGHNWVAYPQKRTRLRQFEISPEEAMTLYLATRLLVKQHDKRNESAETALVKLAEVLTGDVGVGHEIYQAARELAHRPGDVEYSRIFRAVMQSYIYRRKLRMTYEPLNGKPFETLFAPYLLEPSAIGYATYVIGHSEAVDALRTYKLERIRSAVLTAESYNVPGDFPGLEYLRSAWSIVSGEEVVAVKLRFGARVAKRVCETVWHPSQDIADDPEHPGGCIWTAQIADLTDFTPWVRSWGADAEVLAPAELREALVREVRRMGRVYGVGRAEATPLYQRLWAKTDRSKTQTHPLICHLLDVAAVTQVLWDTVLTDSIRAQMGGALGLEPPEAGRLLAFWAGLHDLGKASPCFQRKYPPMEAQLSAAGLLPKRYAQETCPHGTLTARLLPDLLMTETGLPERAAKALAQVLGGHHGAWPASIDMESLTSTQQGDTPWKALRQELFRALRTTLTPPTLTEWPADRATANTFLTLFSGLTSVADWIGSIETYFPYVDSPVDLPRYYAGALAQARGALEKLRWTGWQPPTEARAFDALFPFAPSPMQQVVVELAAQLTEPALVLIEAPTGSGKTEAALYLADTWARTLQQRGVYVAMPTMATSNQMHTRTTRFLQQRYGDTVSPLLIHSQARWQKDAPPPDLAIQPDTENAPTRQALTWFLPRKRSLLAPCAVGTVDQALLSVLQARHFFVRLFGLSHKTVIFDEVHAYDTYMSTLFQRLLGWLHAVGASVVLLSATLPAQTRRDLLAAYAGDGAEIPPVTYPALTWATAGHVGAQSLPTPETEARTLALRRVQREPGDIVQALETALQAGGCAAVICNTVARAQAVYGAIKAAQLAPEEDLTLFHARFPFAWRDEIERRVLARFGKPATRENGARPEKAIVVATQVIEQSLDLDFDVMVSDLAPVDLLLQRAGRLHRHPGRTRPAPVAAPCLFVAVDDAECETPDFDRDIWVYEPYILLRSYLALQGREKLILPRETSVFIEAVYSEEPLPATAAQAAALEAAYKALQNHEGKDVLEAQNRLIRRPSDGRLLNVTRGELEEDAPDIHRDFQALTRLGPPSISLVCLHRTANGWNTEPDGSGTTVNLDVTPDADLTTILARYTIFVNRRDVFNYFMQQESPKPWRDHPLLADHRVAYFTAGVCPLNGTHLILHLDREMGLWVEKENKEAL
ncbi:MAG: CRISPR-associated helicase Cas3' [Anaerolineae bacterium]|nr:CRISPR-associated helicase Cas3' [Anaerolineae bacterium]